MSEEEDSPSEDDDESPLARAGRRVAKCEDGWDLMAGKASAKQIKQEADDEEGQVVADPAGWQLIGALVSIWEEELTCGKPDR